MALSTPTQATIEIKCDFSVDRYTGYKCTVVQIFIDDINEKVDIKGNHMEGYNDARVVFLEIRDSFVKRIPQEFCNRFNNLRTIWATNINLLSLVKLKNCESLETLKFNKNKISYLEPGFLSDLKNFQSLNLEDNLLTELKDSALHTVSQNKDLDFLFLYNPIERIEGTLNNTAIFKNINFKGAGLQSIDPKFMYGFLGRIEWLQFGGKCVDSNLFMDVTPGTVSDVRQNLQRCFNNFIPSETESPSVDLTTTEDPSATTTSKPSEPGSNNMEIVCSADVSKEFYNCEMSMKMKLVFRN